MSSIVPIITAALLAPTAARRPRPEGLPRSRDHGNIDRRRRCPPSPPTSRGSAWPIAPSCRRPTRGDLPGLEALDDCDVALFFTRRLEIDGEPLRRIKDYATSGRPIVGVRTASHGFQNWLEMDALIFGGNYHNHYSNDETTTISVAPGATAHPILEDFEPYETEASLYKTSPLADDCRVLLIGTSPEGREPLAWTREVNGGRVFYTSLGHPLDFERESFRRMLADALFWAARREPSTP